MATTHPTTVRSSLAEAIRTATNAGSGAPKLFIGTSGISLPSTNVLATITLVDFGAASSGVITSAANGQSATAGATGTAAIGIVTDSDNNEVFRGAVAAGSGEVNISSTSISSGDTVTLTSDVTWTAPS